MCCCVSLKEQGHALQIEEHIIKLSKKGVTPSQIGVTLRDSHGVTQVQNLVLCKAKILGTGGRAQLSH